MPTTLDIGSLIHQRRKGREVNRSPSMDLANIQQLTAWLWRYGRKLTIRARQYIYFILTFQLVGMAVSVYFIDYYLPGNYINYYSCNPGVNDSSTAFLQTYGLNPSFSSNGSVLPMCPCFPPDLGHRLDIAFDVLPINYLERLQPGLLGGGHWKPSHCVSRHRIAVIVPFRNRANHLNIFLRHIHPFLQKQQADYRIFVAEQAGSGVFNKAALMNSAFKVILAKYNYSCFIYHDVDMLPEDDRNIYACDDQPRHLGATLDKFRYVLPYPELFGGVIAMKTSHFQKVNGFSNLYTGWGGEDDDMYSRVLHNNLKVYRYPESISRYKMIKHSRDKGNPLNGQRYAELSYLEKHYDQDGLNSLNYKLLKFEERHLYTWLHIDVDGPHFPVGFVRIPVEDDWGSVFQSSANSISQNNINSILLLLVVLVGYSIVR